MFIISALTTRRLLQRSVGVIIFEFPVALSLNLCQTTKDSKCQCVQQAGPREIVSTCFTKNGHTSWFDPQTNN